ncbi:hypothetical protein VTH06DRAFT_7126 [Thermothelomyces fergusii]
MGTMRYVVSWTELLEDLCRKNNIAEPQYDFYSDRRGGRTAWSSTVYVFGEMYSARFWYDGQYLQNACEDAAEVALKSQHAASLAQPGQFGRQQVYDTQLRKAALAASTSAVWASKRWFWRI